MRWLDMEGVWLLWQQWGQKHLTLRHRQLYYEIPKPLDGIKFKAKQRRRRVIFEGGTEQRIGLWLL